MDEAGVGIHAVELQPAAGGVRRLQHQRPTLAAPGLLAQDIIVFAAPFPAEIIRQLVHEGRVQIVSEVLREGHQVVHRQGGDGGDGEHFLHGQGFGIFQVVHGPGVGQDAPHQRPDEPAQQSHVVEHGGRRRFEPAHGLVPGQQVLQVGGAAAPVPQHEQGPLHLLPPDRQGQDQPFQQGEGEKDQGKQADIQGLGDAGGRDMEAVLDEQSKPDIEAAAQQHMAGI